MSSDETALEQIAKMDDDDDDDGSESGGGRLFTNYLLWGCQEQKSV